MSLLQLTAFLTLGLSASSAQDSASSAQDSASGFGSLASDPYAAGLFEELAVTPGPPARVMARNVEGVEAGRPFVNVVRWGDARPYRGRVITLQVPARLDVPSVDTSARLWVRILRADGSVAFEDTGEDQPVGSSEWATLESIGAVAADATDLCFGLLVEGPTPVLMENFSLAVFDEVAATDQRYFVPERWTKDPYVQSSWLTSPATGEPLRVTSFTPAGHATAELPRLWLHSAGLRESYRAGRSFLEAMRRAEDPPAVLCFVEGNPRTVEHVVEHSDVDAEPRGEQLLAVRGTESLSVLHASSEGQGWERIKGEKHQALDALLAGGGAFHQERVLLRWLTASNDAGGERELAEILFDAAVSTLEPWNQADLVRQSSHSLVGHDCGHDHDHSHDHNHDH